MESTLNFYELLGVSRNASAQDIKEAFRKKAQAYHPDKLGIDASEQDKEFWTKRFQQLNEAYQCLSDSRLRADYDARLRTETNSDTYSNTYQNSHNSGGAYTYEDSTRTYQKTGAQNQRKNAQDILNDYVAEMFYAYRRGNLRQYVQTLRLSDLVWKMPRSHYFFIMVLAHLLLNEKKIAGCFYADLGERNFLYMLKRSLSAAFERGAANQEIMDEVMDRIQNTDEDLDGMIYTEPEWDAFGGELHGDDDFFSWDNNPFEFRQYEDSYSYENESYSTPNTSYSTKPDDTNDWESIKKIGCGFLIFIVVILCIVYWRVIVFGIFIIAALLMSGNDNS